MTVRDFPGGPVAKPPCPQCREVPGLILGWGSRSYKPQLGLPCHSEDDEDLHTATKTWCSQIKYINILKEKYDSKQQPKKAIKNYL